MLEYFIYTASLAFSTIQYNKPLISQNILIAIKNDNCYIRLGIANNQLEMFKKGIT